MSECTCVSDICEIVESAITCRGNIAILPIMNLIYFKKLIFLNEESNETLVNADHALRNEFMS